MSSGIQYYLRDRGNLEQDVQSGVVKQTTSNRHGSELREVVVAGKLLNLVEVPVLVYN